MVPVETETKQNNRLNPWSPKQGQFSQIPPAEEINLQLSLSGHKGSIYSAQTARAVVMKGKVSFCSSSFLGCVLVWRHSEGSDGGIPSESDYSYDHSPHPSPPTALVQSQTGSLDLTLCPSHYWGYSDPTIPVKMWFLLYMCHDAYQFYSLCSISRWGSLLWNQLLPSIQCIWMWSESQPGEA